MEFGIQDVLTITGATTLILILVGVVKRAWPNFDSSRWGAVLAIVLGLILVCGANALSLAEVQLGWGQAVLTGILAGASASGIYDAATGTVRGFVDDGVPDEA